MLDWCIAVRGSRSKAGAGRKVEDKERGEDGERATGVQDDSIVIAGQEEGEDAGVVNVSTGAGTDSGFVLEPTLVQDPELNPAWIFDGNGLIRSCSVD